MLGQDAYFFGPVNPRGPTELISIALNPSLKAGEPDFSEKL
jgi:hypothetical protein